MNIPVDSTITPAREYASVGRYPAGKPRAFDLNALTKHLRRRDIRLQAVWVRCIQKAGLLTDLSHALLESECRLLYQGYITAIETPSVAAGDFCSHMLSKHSDMPAKRAYELSSAIAILRDIISRSLCARYMHDPRAMRQALAVFEPAATQMALVFNAELTRRALGDNRQRGSDWALPTPVLTVRDRLLVMPVIGSLAASRARAMVDELLRGIHAHRAAVAVLDLSGVPEIDIAIEAHIGQVVSAASLMGAEIIVTGVSPALAKQLSKLSTGFGKRNMAVDLSKGIERAEKLLGYRVLPGTDRRMGGRKWQSQY